MKISILAMGILGMIFSIPTMASQQCLEEATQAVQEINPDIGFSSDNSPAQIYTFYYEENYCFIPVDVSYSIENDVCAIKTPIFRDVDRDCP